MVRSPTARSAAGRLEPWPGALSLPPSFETPAYAKKLRRAPQDEGRVCFIRSGSAPPVANSEQPDDPPLIVDVDRIRRRHFRQPRHGHDLTADRHDELG